MEYFELYELPVSLKVDKAAVTKKYYELSKAFHPDNFSLSDATKQSEALEKTSHINMARKVLANAHKRLAYLLKEKGVIVTDEKYKLPPMFLGEMMEINEALMELQFEPDAKNKEKIIAQVENEVNKLYKTVASFFEAEELVLDEASSAQLKDYYYKKKYLDRIKEKL